MRLKSCFKDYKLFLSYVLTFIIFSNLLTYWWAIVILITIQLLDSTFNREVDIFAAEEHIEISIRQNKTCLRRYRIAKRRSKNKNSIFFTESALFEEKYFTKNINSFSQNYMLEQKMYGSHRQRNFVKRRPVTLKGNSGNDSLTTMVQKKFEFRKENVQPNQQQPIVAVVKNNINISRKLSSENSPKSPLYNTYRSAIAKSPLIHSLSNSANNWMSVNTNNTISNSEHARNITGLSFKNENSSFPNQNENLENKELNNVLEVHGSYFINRSLINSKIGEELEISTKSNDSTYSNKNNTVKDIDQNAEATCREDETSQIFDTTSAEAVVSILKEKSKRKRSIAVQSPSSVYSKRVKFDRTGNNDALDKLFPSIPAEENKAINKKKRLVSIGTQYETAEQNEVAMPIKRTRTLSSPSKSRIGLTEEQTNDLLGEESMSQNKLNDLSSPTSSETLSEFLNKEKASNDSTNGSFLNTNESFNYKGLAPGNSSFTKVVKKVGDGDFISSPDTSNYNDTFSSPTVKKSLLKTSLRNVKSPYKRIIPASFTPGTASKLRKHAVFFTAKLNIDEIQRNREEFGCKGVSLKAFRHEHENALKRINDIFDEVNDEDNKTSVTNLSTTSASLFTSASSSSVISNSSPFLTASASSLPSSTSSSINLITNTAINALPTSKTVSVNTGYGLSLAPSATTSSVTAASSSVKVMGSSLSSSMAPFSFGFKSVSSDASKNSTISASLETNKPVASHFPVTGFNFNLPKTSSESAPKSFDGTAKLEPPKSATPINNAGFTMTTKANIAIPTVSGITVNNSPFGQAPKSTGFSFGISSTAAVPTNSSISPLSTSNTVTTSTSSIPNNALPLISARNASNPSVATFNFMKSSSGNEGNVSSSSSGINFNFATSSENKTNISQADTNESKSNVPATSTPSIFGITSQANPTSIFASSNQSIFGNPSVSATSTSSQFGNQTLNVGFSFSLPSVSKTGPAVSNNGLPSQPSIFAGLSTQNQSSGNTSNLTASSSGPSNTTSIGFGVPNTTAPSFGISNTSIFGAPATTISTFGVSKTNAPIFGVSVTPATINGVTPSTGALFKAPSTSAAIFGTAATTASIFGANTTTPSIFGATTTASIFGGAAATSSIFKSVTTSSSVFGVTSAVTTPSIFGQPGATSIFGATSSTPSIFGASATSTSIFSAPTSNSSIFSAQPTGTPSMFGSQPTAVSTTTPSIFGTQPTTTASVFGAQPMATASMFGASQTNTGSIFGAPTTNAPAFGVSQNQFASTNSIFGATNQTTNPNPFSQQPSQGQQGGFDFSSSMKQAPTFNFGGQSNTMQAPKPAFNFNAQPSTPSVGTPTIPNFGSPSFGSGQGSPFGTPTFNSPAGGFSLGTGGNQQQRQTSRARRRLRR